MLDSLFCLNKGELANISESIRRGTNTAVFGLAENNRFHIASQIEKPFLYVASDLVTARAAFERLQEYCSREVALLSEGEDVLITRKSGNSASIGERMRVLSRCATGEILAIVTTVEALCRYYPAAEALRESIVRIEAGKDYDMETVCNRLVYMGYKRSPSADIAGTFTIRGDIIDVFIAGEELPVRIEFFGDTVETIKRFYPDTFTSAGALSHIAIYPITDIMVPDSAVTGAVNAVKRAKKNCSNELADKADEEIERFVSFPSSPLNNFFIPFIKPYLTVLYNYFDKDSVIVFDDIKVIEDKIRVYNNAHAQRVKTMNDANLVFKEHTESIPDEDELKIETQSVLGFSKTLCTVRAFTVQAIFNIKAQSLPPFYHDMPSFFEQLKGLSRSGARAVIYVRDEGAKKAVTASVADEFIGVGRDDDENAFLRILTGNISYGFIYPSEKLLCVGIYDLSRRTERSKSDKRKRLAFELPEKGDFVVHEKHGIGISEGIQRVKTPGGEKDFYIVLYRDGDRLYLPVEQLDSLDKYNGADQPSLHKLGGAEFERVKQRVKASVKEMAINLLELYQSRHNRKGFVYQPDTAWQEEFENDFEYPETDDQLIAVDEIKRDMETGKIMDRLLCGDVGYGKTEVALRAVFKTVIEHKQAAILVPTTVLAQQHYALVSRRMEKFGIKTELLSRFVSKQEIKESLKRLESGESHIVVATHRLLSGDVKFFDLGLLVLDEEQRFGVEHKEKLKVYRNKVNILSMSATPIPRTLHMSLSGIRDISTLETPPRNRLPVETYITYFSDALLADAINKEINRGGQAFILYNRVADIDIFYDKVQKLLPAAKVIYAHGQMGEEELEQRIDAFYAKTANVLISTTIIENGIDLPDANTLFVVNADCFGLSQLYQLRGRVGRSTVQAYAYFTLQEGKILTDNAAKRLDALMDSTELGSGFKIAMRDLEIRGAGNLLGREQHGQMERVGYEMFLRLVKEGIDEIQGKVSREDREIEVNIDGGQVLEDDYISDSKARVMFYKRIAMLQTKQEANEYYESLEKLYGKPPETVRNIIRIGLIKNLAQKMGIKKAVVSQRGTGLYFHDSACLTDERLFNALSAYSKYCVLSPVNPPAVIFDTKGIPQSTRIKLVLEFLFQAL